VTLRYRFGEGERWRWSVRGSLSFAPGPGDGLTAVAAALLGARDEPVALSAEVDFTVGEVRDDGWCVLSVDGNRGQARIEVDPLGRRRLAASKGGGSALDFLHPERSLQLTALDLGPRLPERAVGRGGSWEHEAKGVVLRDRSGRVELRLDCLVRYRVVDYDSEGGGLIIEMEVVRKELEIIDVERGRVVARKSSTGAGSAIFDALEGVLISSEVELRTRWSSDRRHAGEITYTERLEQRLRRITGNAAE
jgi:hypothetical protein